MKSKIQINSIIEKFNIELFLEIIFLYQNSILSSLSFVFFKDWNFHSSICFHLWPYGHNQDCCNLHSCSNSKHTFLIHQIVLHLDYFFARIFAKPPNAQTHLSLCFFEFLIKSPWNLELLGHSSKKFGKMVVDLKLYSKYLAKSFVYWTHSK